MAIEDEFQTGATGDTLLRIKDGHFMRALLYLEALTEPLLWLDVRGLVAFSPDAVNEFCVLSRMENLHTHGLFISDSGEVVLLAEDDPEAWEELKPQLVGLTRYCRLLPGHEFPPEVFFDEGLPPEALAQIAARAGRFKRFTGFPHFEGDASAPPDFLLNEGVPPPSQDGETRRAQVLDLHGHAMLRLAHYLDDDDFIGMERISRDDLRALAGRNLRRFSA